MSKYDARFDQLEQAIAAHESTDSACAELDASTAFLNAPIALPTLSKEIPLSFTQYVRPVTFGTPLLRLAATRLPKSKVKAPLTTELLSKAAVGAIANVPKPADLSKNGHTIHIVPSVVAYLANHSEEDERDSNITQIYPSIDDTHVVLGFSSDMLNFCRNPKGLDLEEAFSVVPRYRELLVVFFNEIEYLCPTIHPKLLWHQRETFGGLEGDTDFRIAEFALSEGWVDDIDESMLSHEAALAEVVLRLKDQGYVFPTDYVECYGPYVSPMHYADPKFCKKRKGAERHAVQALCLRSLVASCIEDAKLTTGYREKEKLLEVLELMTQIIIRLQNGERVFTFTSATYRVSESVPSLFFGGLSRNFQNEVIDKFHQPMMETGDRDEFTGVRLLDASSDQSLQDGLAQLEKALELFQMCLSVIYLNELI